MDISVHFDHTRATRGRRRGRRSRELLSVRYESLWEQPVAALAELLYAPA